ncbi:MAG: PilZ domain-containing protein [Betaproteobacteria bacterium]|nr:PilZ domain-containing protein [Betaproteobacteria bacterium]
MPYKFPSFMTAFFSRQPLEGDEAATPGRPEGGGTSDASGSDERRIHQRFIARLDGEPCFWALIGEERLALNDLSLKGFALPTSPALVPGAQFDFILQREGMPDTIQGRAEVASVFGRDALSAGCRIIHFEGDSGERLQEWLVVHVIRNATVRISEKDAAAIVSGRSLV